MTAFTPCALQHIVRGRHLDHCADPTCPGCLPAQAEHGSHACSHHDTAARRALRDLPGLWADLGDPRLTPGTSSGGSPSGEPEACPHCDTGQDCDVDHRGGHEVISEQRITARTDIRAWLTDWGRALHTRYDAPAPTSTDSIRWLTHQVATRAGRILTHPDDARLLLAGLLGYDAADGWHPGLTAYRRLIDGARRPTGVRVQCPRCEAWVRLQDSEAVVRCPGTLTTGEACTEWGTIEHWRQLVAPGADQPMTATELAAWLWDHHRHRATEATIWQWASRGTRHGKLTRVTDEAGVTRYDPVRAAELVMMIRGVGTPHHTTTLDIPYPNAASS